MFSARGAGEGFLFSAGEAWAAAEVGAASPRGTRAPSSAAVTTCAEAVSFSPR